MPSGRDISVVVQGPVWGNPGDPPEKQITQRALASVRAVWPAAEVILSTWQGAETSHLGYDKLVLSEDPGAVAHNDTARPAVFNNLNRQITTTHRGLAQATRQYAVKLRSDCQLLRPVDFGLAEPGTRQPRWTVFQGRILVLNIYTRHPLRLPVLFHLSDLFHAGLRTDLTRLWSIPLVEEPAFTRTRDPNRRPFIDAYPLENYLFRCSPEQYLGEQLARRLAPAMRLRSIEDGSVDQLFLWLRLLANNFCVLSPGEAGVRLPDRMAQPKPDRDLFQPGDRAWLELWSQPSTPAAARGLAAWRYFVARGRCALPVKWLERFGKIFRRRLRRQLSRLKQWLLSAKLILG